MDLNKGKKQLSEIIKELSNYDDFPNFDFTNRILDSRHFEDGISLWFHWGHLLIHKKTDGCVAGENYVLDDWNTEEDGTMTFLGSKKLKEVL